MGWIGTRIEKANWVSFVVWLAILMAFSMWAFLTDSPWTRVLEAAGGFLPETIPGIPAIEPVRSLEAIGENRGDYLLWQLLDIPYAIMNFMVVSIALGLGLKALRLDASLLRFLLLLPAIYVACELVENALVASFAAEILPTAEPLVLLQQFATSLKFASLPPAVFLGAIGVALALGLPAIRLVRK